MLAVLALLLVALIGISFAVPVYASIHVRKNGADDDIVICLHSVRRLVYHKFEVPIFRFDTSHVIPKISVTAHQLETDDKIKAEYRYEIWLTNLKRIRAIFLNASSALREIDPLVKYVRKHATLVRFHWHTEIGIGDAAITSLAVGMIWSGKAPIINYVQSVFPLPADYGFSVQPSFHHEVFRTDVNCILKSSIGHIIIGNVLLWWKLKIRQRRV